MQIVMRPDATEEQIKTVQAHLEVMGSHLSISRDTGGTTIHTEDDRWQVHASIEKMPGIAKIEQRPAIPRFIEGDPKALTEFLDLFGIKMNTFHFFGSNVFDVCPGCKLGKVHEPHSCFERKVCLGKSGFTNESALIIVIEERPQALGPGNAKGVFFYVPRSWFHSLGTKEVF